MAAHGGAVIEVKRENGKWQVVARLEICAPHRCRHADGDHRPGRRPRAHADHGRSDRPPRARHAQQLRRRHDAVGHVAHLRGELPRLFLGQARRRPSRGAQLQALWRARQLAMPGASSTTASTSPRSRTRPTASAGSSRSIRSIRLRRRRSAPRSAAASTKAPPASSTRTAATSSIPATTSASTMSTASSPRHASIAPIRAANRDLLDDGTLSVARYNADGTLDWLPLVHGQGPLTAANGFASQADVLIETRRAADLLGATKMDRPEDVEANPMTGKVYVMLTNNAQPQARAGRRRQSARRQPLRPHHRDDRRRTATMRRDKFRWEILVRCGDPAVAAVGATFSTDTTQATAGSACRTISRSTARAGCGSRPTATPRKRTGRADGLWGVETEGPARGTSTALLPRAGRRRAVRPVLHARRRDAVRRRAASGREARSTPNASLDLRRAVDALAGFQAGHAAAPVGGRHHQARRRQDRDLAPQRGCVGWAKRSMPTPAVSASSETRVGSARSRGLAHPTHCKTKKGPRGPF